MYEATNREPVRVGIWLLADQPVREIAARAQLAESVGLDFVGITDGQMIWRDVYLCLAAAALATERVGLGPWVTNPITRHPTVTASALCTLDELSGGRAFLGVGAGDDSVKTINLLPATLDKLGEEVGVIRTLAGAGSIPADPIEWRLATGRSKSPPIYWAAAGPRSFRHGGRYADGVIDTGWLVPEMLREAITCIEEGASSAGKRPDQVAKLFNSGFAVADDTASAWDDARTYVAKGLMYRRSANVPGWSEVQRQELLAAYNYHQHLAVDQPAVERVPQEMITKKSIAGTADEAVALLHMVVDAGYTHIALLPLGDVEQAIRKLGEQVAPRLR